MGWSQVESGKRFLIATLVFLQTLLLGTDVHARDQRIDATYIFDLKGPNKLAGYQGVSNVCTDTWEYTVSDHGTSTVPAESWVGDWSRGLDHLEDPKEKHINSRQKHKYEIAKKKFQSAQHLIYIPKEKFKYDLEVDKKNGAPMGGIRQTNISRTTLSDQLSSNL